MEIGNGTLAAGSAAGTLAGGGALISAMTSSGGVTAGGVALGTVGLAGLAAGGYAGWQAYKGYSGGDKAKLSAGDDEGNGLITDTAGAHDSQPGIGTPVDEKDKQAELASQAQKDKEALDAGTAQASSSTGETDTKTVARGANGEVHTTIEELPNESQAGQPKDHQPVRLNLSANPDGTVHAKLHVQPETHEAAPHTEELHVVR